MFRLLRAPAAALTTGVVAALLLVPGGATASPIAARGGSTLHDKDLPTVEEAATVFPVLEGGSNVNHWHPGLYVRDDSCLQEEPHSASDGRYTTYLTADGIEAPREKARPFGMVFDFKDPRFPNKASRAMDLLHDAAERCEGKHGEGDDAVVSRELDLPRLGADDTVTWLQRSTIQGDPSWAAISYVRVGKRISLSKVYRIGHRIGSHRIKAWRRLAVAAAFD